VDNRFGGEPLQDEGVKIATLNRGPNRELRIRWKQFKGHNYLDVREWSVNPMNSQWWPVKGKGVTIKPQELAEVAAAITRASTIGPNDSRGANSGCRTK